ncbi:carbohydrate ABC transporter permease, partial [Mycobacterium tuberculosis]|nr:carbohydrate ABC transporter permease [Mycobacterium tuberculosis]
YFASLPLELFKAARIDGASFFQIFFYIMLPMATPMVIVAVILQVTGIWNDFILGLVFAGRENLPMTVQLNNIVNSTQGERAYNVDMA